MKSAAILSQIQKDAFAWAKKNFGASLTPETQLLGLGEEAGEAAEAMGAPDVSEFLDAIGDSTIFLCQFCSLMGWDIAALWISRKLYELPSRPWPILLGRINHHYVKGHVQHYRGTQAEHEFNCCAAIAALLRHWDEHLTSMNQDFLSVVQFTWSKVSKRDWTKDRPAPSVRNDGEFPPVDPWPHTWQISDVVPPNCSHCDGTGKETRTLSVEALDEREESPLDRVFGKLPDLPVMECGDTIITTKNGFERFSSADQATLADFEKKQDLERAAFVESLLAKRRAPTGEVVRGLAAVIDALGDTDAPTKEAP
jgi:NTP pyrophosphatase (non-canonical NTP hydrolase)